VTSPVLVDPMKLGRPLPSTFFFIDWALKIHSGIHREDSLNRCKNITTKSRCKSFLIGLLSFQNQQELLQLTLLREAETGMLSTCTTLIKRGTQQELMFHRAINYFKG